MSAFLNPILNGVCPSWADIQVRVSGTDVALLEMGDIAAINTGATVEVGEQKEGSRVIARTQGAVAYEASWTLYASGVQRLLRGLKDAAPVQGGQKQLSLVHFNINILWTPKGSAEIFEKRLKGCRILSDTEDSAEGVDAAQVEMALSPLQICRVIDGEEIVLL
jgi:hypothetical protein